MGMFTNNPSSKGDHHRLSSPCSLHPCGSRSNATTLLALISGAAILGNVYFRAPMVPGTGGAISSTPGLLHQLPAVRTRQATAPLPCPVPTASTATSAKSTRGRKKGPTFVFVVGLEGTGHHLHNLLVSQSPNHVALGKLKLHESILAVSELLFGAMGLMTVHCLETSPKLVPVPSNATNRCPRLDTPCLHRELVGELRHIHAVVTQADQSLLVYVNTNALMRPNMASYPSFQHACRSLQYPILDLYYDACDDAGVDCRHVYLYRDPYAVLQSSLRRNFNKGPLSGMQLYTTMLLVLQAQFMTRPDRAIGCLGLYEGTGHATDTEDWDALRRLLGYDAPIAFQESVQSIFKPPTPLSDEARKALVPPPHQQYVGPYLRAYDTMLQLCREQVATNTAGCSTDS